MGLEGRNRSANQPVAEPLPATPPVLPGARTWLAAALLAGLVAAAAFRPMLGNYFACDDADILENTHCRGLGPQHLSWMLTTPHGGRYQPLAWASLGLDYSLWGLNPGGYHLSNLALHVATSVLVYVLALALIGAGGQATRRGRASWAAHLGALLAGLLFAMHPLRVEAVAWASQRGGLLSAFFLLLSVLLYVRGAQAAKRWPWLAWALVCYALSLAAGPLGVMLPVVLLVLDGYPLHRLGRARSLGTSRTLGGVWLEKLPFLALAAGAAAVALWARTEAPVAITETPPQMVERLGQAAYGLVFYTWKTVRPRDLAPLYELHLPVKLLSVKYLGSIAAVLVAIVGLTWRGRRVPAVVTAAACYVALLLPVLGLVHLGPREVADRYSYLPSIAWAVLAGAGLSRLWAMRGLPLRCLAGGVTVLGLLGAGGLTRLTRQQCRVWQTPLTLWTHAFEREPSSGLLQYNLARELDRDGQTKRALQLYRAAIATRSGLLEAHYGLGAGLQTVGRFAEAVEAYRRALQVAPQSALTRYHLGNALAAVGEIGPAAEHLLAAVALDPARAASYRSLGNLYGMTGRWSEAIEQYRAALALEPHNAELHYELGRAQRRGGYPEKAARAFRAALELDPQHKLARRALDELANRAGNG